LPNDNIGIILNCTYLHLNKLTFPVENHIGLPSENKWKSKHKKRGKGKKVLLPAKQEKPLNRENRKYTTIAKHISLIFPVEI